MESRLLVKSYNPSALSSSSSSSSRRVCFCSLGGGMPAASGGSRQRSGTRSASALRRRVTSRVFSTVVCIDSSRRRSLSTSRTSANILRTAPVVHTMWRSVLLEGTHSHRTGTHAVLLITLTLITPTNLPRNLSTPNHSISLLGYPRVEHGKTFSIGTVPVFCMLLKHRIWLNKQRLFQYVRLALNIFGSFVSEFVPDRQQTQPNRLRLCSLAKTPLNYAGK